jgi:hypothetical protein
MAHPIGVKMQKYRSPSRAALTISINRINPLFGISASKMKVVPIGEGVCGCHSAARAEAARIEECLYFDDPHRSG